MRLLHANVYWRHYLELCSHVSLGLQGTVINAPAQTLIMVRPTLTVWSYSVKVINRARKSEWTVQKLRVNQQFGSLEELKQQVSDSLKDAVENPISTSGYIEAGHGARGKQRWLTTDEDLMIQVGVKFFGLFHLRTQLQVLPLALLMFEVRSVHTLRSIVH